MCVCLRKYSIKVGDRIACARDVVTFVSGSVYRLQITREGNALLLMLLNKEHSSLFATNFYYRIIATPLLVTGASRLQYYRCDTIKFSLSCQQHARTFEGFKFVHTEELCSLSLSLSLLPPSSSLSCRCERRIRKFWQ